MSRKGAKQPRRRRPSNPDLVQAGKRPSSPFMLLAIGLLWIGAGVIALTKLSASWKFVPSIFFIGVGVLWLRGAAVTLSRHERRSEDR